MITTTHHNERTPLLEMKSTGGAILGPHGVAIDSIAPNHYSSCVPQSTTDFLCYGVVEQQRDALTTITTNTQPHSAPPAVAVLKNVQDLRAPHSLNHRLLYHQQQPSSSSQHHSLLQSTGGSNHTKSTNADPHMIPQPQSPNKGGARRKQTTTASTSTSTVYSSDPEPTYSLLFLVLLLGMILCGNALWSVDTAVAEKSSGTTTRSSSSATVRGAHLDLHPPQHSFDGHDNSHHRILLPELDTNNNERTGARPNLMYHEDDNGEQALAL
jgi:hypothetical protein